MCDKTMLREIKQKEKPLRCDWLEEARIQILGNVILGDYEKGILNTIIDSLKKERLECYHAHLDAVKAERERIIKIIKYQNFECWQESHILKEINGT